jgi:LPXTG-motif cell wall-anchored protein
MNATAATPTGTNANTSAAALANTSAGTDAKMLANTGANIELLTAALLLLAAGMTIMLVLYRRKKA